MEHFTDPRMEILIDDNKTIKTQLSRIAEILQKIAVTEEKLVTQERINGELKEKIADHEVRIRSLEDTKLTAQGMINGAALLWGTVGTGLGAVVMKIFF